MKCCLCAEPANGSSLDWDGVTLIWYCRAHHPMMPGGVAARGHWEVGKGSSYNWIRADNYSVKLDRG